MARTKKTPAVQIMEENIEVKEETVEKAEEEKTVAEEEVKAEPKKRTRTKKAEEPSEIDLLKAQIEELKAQLQQSASAPVQAVLVDSGEKVHLLWQAPVMDENVLLIGDNGAYGRITGKSGSAFIPKSELSRILDASMRSYIDMRWMIVVSGLDEEERESLGVNYKEGEILDKKAFENMIKIGDQMLEIYPNLCDEHKEIVAKTYYEAYKNKKFVKRELVLELNKIQPEPAFKKIIEEMNEADLAE